MGALAAQLAPRPLARRAAAPRRRFAPLGALTFATLGGSYFSASVAARGWPTSPYDDLIAQAASDTGVDPSLIRAIISAESAWDPSVCSNRPIPPGSCGLMQLNVAAHGITQAQATDPTFNIPFATRLLADQVRRRSSVQLAIAAYNAGTSRSEADLQDRITRDVNGVGTYVQTVLDYLNWFQSQGAGPAPATDASGADASAATGAEQPAAFDLTAITSALDPWQWWALGGVAVLGVTLVVLRRRRRR